MLQGLRKTIVGKVLSTGMKLVSNIRTVSVGPLSHNNWNQTKLKFLAVLDYK